MAIYKDLVIKISVPSDKKIKQRDYLGVGLLPIIDQSHSMIGGYTNDLTKAIECDFPVVIFGDHTKCVKLVSFPFAPGADGIKVLQPKPGILPKYLYYGTQYLTFRTENKGYARHYQYIEKKDLAVPSDSEQKRIVSKIEELFSRLDASVAELQTAKERLKVYRQTVLYKAFQNLTDIITMDEVADMIDPQPSHRTPPEVSNGVPYIGVGDIDYSARKINFAEARKVSSSVLQEHQERYTIHKGDFIMGKIGTIGKPFMVPLPQNYTLSANVILIQPNYTKILPEFLYWQFSSPLVTQQLTVGAAATSQPAFGIKKARLLSIRICDINQQRHITNEIEKSLSVCDSIEQTIGTSLHQAEALRQSILKQAFEGKL